MPRLVLVSRSPRRRRLLEEHGLEHDAEHPEVDDGVLEPGRVGPESWAAALAYLKAAAGAERGAERGTEGGGGADRLYLGADTLCVKDGRVIGQPRDAADAERILLALENGEHDVVTGVALVWGGADPAEGVRPAGRTRRVLFADRARVRVGEIGTERIRDYVASGQWRGKAGAYNLSERLEAGWPIEYDGDPGTIMGLPMRALLRELGAWARDRRGEVA